MDHLFLRASLESICDYIHEMQSPVWHDAVSICFCHCTLSIFVKCFLNSSARVANHRPSSNCWETQPSDKTINRNLWPPGRWNNIILLTWGDDTSQLSAASRRRLQLWIEYELLLFSVIFLYKDFVVLFAQPRIDLMVAGHCHGICICICSLLLRQTAFGFELQFCQSDNDID